MNFYSRNNKKLIVQENQRNVKKMFTKRRHVYKKLFMFLSNRF